MCLALQAAELQSRIVKLEGRIKHLQKKKDDYKLCFKEEESDRVSAAHPLYVSIHSVSNSQCNIITDVLCLARSQLLLNLAKVSMCFVSR